MQERTDPNAKEKITVWIRFRTWLIERIKNFSWRRLWSQFRHGGWKKAIPALCLIGGIFLAVLASTLMLNVAVCHKTEDRIVTQERLVQMEGQFDLVLVLGCKAYPDGRLSDRLTDRVEVGVTLYQSGIGKALLMSGDRQDDGSYDEVGAMQNAAMTAGVTEGLLTDPRGYSTYESIVRAKELFGARRIVIVTQEYHLYRSLYIAEKLGIEAYGVSADLRPFGDQLRCEVREIFARVKDVFYAQARPEVDLRPS